MTIYTHRITIATLALTLLFVHTAAAQEQPIKIHIDAPAPAFVDENSKLMERRVSDMRKTLEHRRNAKLIHVVDTPDEAQVVLRIVSFKKELVPNTGKGFWGDLGKDVGNSINTAQGGAGVKERQMVEQHVMRAELIAGDYRTEMVYGDSTQPQPLISTQVERWVKANQEALR